MQLKAEIRHELANLRVLAVDELTTGFERDLIEALVSNRPDASAETIASFDQVNVGAAIDEAARRGETRQSAADHEHARALERRT